MLESSGQDSNDDEEELLSGSDLSDSEHDDVIEDFVDSDNASDSSEGDNEEGNDSYNDIKPAERKQKLAGGSKANKNKKQKKS